MQKLGLQALFKAGNTFADRRTGQTEMFTGGCERSRPDGRYKLGYPVKCVNAVFNCGFCGWSEWTLKEYIIHEINNRMTPPI